jgi:hypothetical protein
VKNNGNKEGSSKETSSEEDREEDRKEEIRKVLWDLGLEKRFSSLFFLFAVFFAVFLRYETPFWKKIQEKSVTY